MKISTKLRERFCKDCNIPINIFQEPYFTDRLKLYDKFYGTLEKWDIFVKELEKSVLTRIFLFFYKKGKKNIVWLLTKPAKDCIII
jgi:hypothetical protein